MDTKNVIAAISLSAAVLILYSLFFVPEPSPNQLKKEVSEKTNNVENSDTPSLDQSENISEITREQALAENERVKFENNNIIGSISLKGAVIDDLTFKQYNTELNSNEKVVLLNPRNNKNGYLIESGFVTNNKNIDLPNSSTIWKIVGNKKLTDKTPIKLVWENSQGISFEKSK